MKSLLLELKSKVDTFELIMPKELSLTDIVRDFKKFKPTLSRQTLLAYLKSNFEPEVDFYKENNKIYVNVSILCSLRRHYAK